jgi:hypothetical protein
VEHHVDRCTPQVLFDLYCLLSDEHKREFLKLLGTVSTAEAPFLLVGKLSVTEQFRFSQLVFSQLLKQYLPVFEAEARKIAREDANISDAEFDKLLHERVKQIVEYQVNAIAELERAQIKQQRDRKSDP